MTLSVSSFSPYLRFIPLGFLFLIFSFQSYAQENEKLNYELIFLSDDPLLIGKGETKNGVRTGKWVISTQDSLFLQMGSYDRSGMKTGLWQVFIDGVERARMTYQNDQMNGKYLLFDPNRTVIVSTYMKDDLLDGSWTSFTSRNERYENGQFKKGKKIGIWTTYFTGIDRRRFNLRSSDQKEIVAEYRNGVLHGTYRQFNLFGEVIIRTNYSNGQLDGKWLKYDRNREIERGYFVDGKRDSTWTFYEFGTYDTFLASEETYTNGSRTGLWTTYHSNGRKASETYYENDLPVGESRTWHRNKQLASLIRYKLGLADSAYVEYFRGGEVAVEGQWNLGLKEGTWKYYHENSLIAEIGDFKSDKKTGNWKAFNENGRLVSEGNFLFGKEMGQWFNYHDNGNLSSIGSFNEGLRDGLWGFFHTDGKPMAEETWKNGKLLSVSDFTNSKGRVLPTGTLANGEGNRINYTPDGTKFSEGPYKNGQPNGIWTFFDEKGRKLMYGELVNGIKQGEWLIYARSGRVVRVETFQAGELIDSVLR